MQPTNHHFRTNPSYAKTQVHQLFKFRQDQQQSNQTIYRTRQNLHSQIIQRISRTSTLPNQREII